MQKYSQKVCVIGLGYIGLPTAALLACEGYEVCGVDLDIKVVDTINNGEVHIIEPELDTFVRKAIQSGNLKASLIANEADIYIICVPTPFLYDEDLPTPNLQYVLRAAESIIKLIKPGDMIILESTSPVGTTDIIKDLIVTEGLDIASVSIAYCPERVLPGRIMTELVSNDRIIGGISREATLKVENFYRTFVNGEVLTCSARTAEMCKLAENSFRDVNIAFANELSMLCDTYNIDPWELIRLANHHPRVNILQPGTGVGGHCIAVDPWFLVSGDPESSRLIKKARQVNDSKPDWVVSKILAKVEDLVTQGIKDPVVACLGLSFKPNIDDLRESPAVTVVERLLQSGIDIIVVEPNLSDHEIFKLRTFDEALSAEITVILVNHQEFSDAENKDKLIKANAMDFCGALA